MSLNKIYALAIFVAIFVGVFASCDYASAGTAVLTWNANTEPDLAGYRVYYGTVSRIGTTPCANAGYASNVNVGNVTTYTFNNLTDGATYYFAVSAYDTSNNESACSTQQSKVIPASSVTNVIFVPSIETIISTAGKNFTITLIDSPTLQQKASFTYAPNASGQIIPTSTDLSNVTTGNYDILIDSSYCLRKRQNNVAIASNATINLPAIFAGDLNDDGIINSLDWSPMNSAWFTNNATSDINKDSVVNSVDFSFMNRNWLRADE